MTCEKCIPGTEANKDSTGCTPCKEGYYNSKEMGTCTKCPAFTTSARHSKDHPIFKNGVKNDTMMTEAATACELDTELHVRQTGQIYKASHFKARTLCGKDVYMKNSNICAGEGIIGPISDVEHVSKIKADKAPVDDEYDEDEDWDAEDFEFDPDFEEMMKDDIEFRNFFDDEFDDEEDFEDWDEEDEEDYDEEDFSEFGDDFDPEDGEDEEDGGRRMLKSKNVNSPKGKKNSTPNVKKNIVYGENDANEKHEKTKKRLEPKVGSENLFFFTD